MSNVDRKKVQLPGGALTYRRAGTGAPLLFLHGLGGSSMSWIRQLETLSRDFTVIAWDAPGYGGSERRTPDVESHAEAAIELIEALGVAPVALVGHSMGGVVAGRVAAKRPDLLEMVILSSTFVGKRASPDKPLGEGFQKRIHDLKTLDRKEFGVARAKAMVADGTPPESLRAVAEIAADVDEEGFVDACTMLNYADNTGVLGDIQLPVLILEAAEDGIITRQDGDLLAELIPHAERAVQAGVGHAPYLEDPQQYNRYVTEFLRKQIR